MKNNTKALLFLLLSLFTSIGMCAHTVVKNEEVHEEPNKPIIVAVVDTGFDYNSTWKNLPADSGLQKPKLCKYGSKDFTGFGLQDVHGHGTHVAGLIAKYAEKSNYCLVILKYYHNNKSDGNMVHTFQAFQRAIDLKVNIINYSGGGVEKSDYECSLMKKALDMGIIVVAAAGNEYSDINKKPYYPAMCDDRIMAVGNVYDNGMPVASSNYTNYVMLNARGLFTEKGFGVLSTGLNDGVDHMTGTSQAAAIKTGKTVKELSTP